MRWVARRHHPSVYSAIHGPKMPAARVTVTREGSSVTKGQYASVSRVTFDGRGQFTINEIGRFNGDPVDRTFTGPYVVNSDCTGYLDYSSTLSNPPHQAHGKCNRHEADQQAGRSKDHPRG